MNSESGDSMDDSFSEQHEECMLDDPGSPSLITKHNVEHGSDLNRGDG